MAINELITNHLVPMPQASPETGEPVLLFPEIRFSSIPDL